MSFGQEEKEMEEFISKILKLNLNQKLTTGKY